MYKIGDIIAPKYNRHKDWGERLIVDFDYNEYDNNSLGYLWVYSDRKRLSYSIWVNNADI